MDDKTNLKNDLIEESTGKPFVLCKRKSEVLKLMCEGITNKYIANKLFLSIHTIEGHKAKLLHKTNTKSSAELVLLTIKKKIIKL